VLLLLMLLPVNDPPYADRLTKTTLEDTPISINLLSSVSDVDTGDTLTISIATGPTHGTLVQTGAAGTWLYTPSANYNGADYFVYKVTYAKIERIIVLLSAFPEGEARCRCQKVWLTRNDCYYFKVTYASGAFGTATASLTITPGL
jgi:hypothetical protein